MVHAQHRLLTEGLGVQHLRAIIGYSMGGMHTWLWAQQHPEFMDLAVPMACMPTPLSGRNWMMRRMVIDAIRTDPEWQGGEYQRPLRSAHFALTYYAVATSGGTWGLYESGPDQAKASAWQRPPRNCPRGTTHHPPLSRASQSGPLFHRCRST